MALDDIKAESDYKTEIEKNGVIGFVPGGNSMWPILKHRGQSVVVKQKTQRLKKFDVAFYQRSNGAFVLHRVMDVTNDGYVMCGDSQLVYEKVSEEQVFGVMEGFYSGKNYVECSDEKYCQRVEKWYKRKRKRKFILKMFYFWQRVKNKFKRIFKKSGETK